MNILVLVKLVLAHILSDFVIQTDGFCKLKSSSTCKGKCYILIHGLVHAVVTYVLLAEWSNFLIPLLIFFTHSVIDYLKIKSKKQGMGSFLIDQLAHLIILLLLWFHYFSDLSIIKVISELWSNYNVWIILLAYLLILKPTSIVLKIFTKKWQPDLEKHPHSTSQSIRYISLENAGEWIGYLERLLIVTFILFNHFSGVGFLLAAKSIFRFGSLNKATEIKATEYVLVGTLTSFSIAIVVGLITQQLINGVV